MVVHTQGISDNISCQESKSMCQTDLNYLPLVLGQGNGGVVRKAIYKPEGCAVAVKVINVYDKEKRHQLYNELRLQKAMQSDFLLRLHGAFFHDGSVRLVFEFMDLGCLETLISTLKRHAL